MGRPSGSSFFNQDVVPGFLLDLGDGLFPSLTYPFIQLAFVEVKPFASFVIRDFPAADLHVWGGDGKVKEGGGLRDIEDRLSILRGLLLCQQQFQAVHFLVEQAHGLWQLVEGEIFHDSVWFGLHCNGRDYVYQVTSWHSGILLVSYW